VPGAALCTRRAVRIARCGRRGSGTIGGMSTADRLVACLLVVGLAVAPGLAGCGEPAPAEPGPDAGLPEGWSQLLAGDWTLAPGAERYYCVYATVPRDTVVKAFRAISPEGTHHTVLTRYDGPVPDGTYTCTVATNGQTMVYGSGVGTPDFVFPDGVGLRLRAGTRLLLNLHLYNATEQPITGRSGTLVQLAGPEDVEHDAELVLAGPTSGLEVPPGVSTQSGRCELRRVAREPIQVFAVGAHMHKLGRHVRSVVRRPEGDLVLQDRAYAFEHQDVAWVAPQVELRPDDVLTTYCSYDNQTGETVGFGESSDDEMCFTELFYYPAQNANFTCTDF
jgi:hypothetical protein